MSFRSRKSKIDDSYFYKGYSIVLYPTEEQKSYFEKSINLSRFVYNWTKDQIELQKSLYNADVVDRKFISEYELQKKLSEFRNENEWLQEVPLGTLRNAMFDCIKAYDYFYDKRYRNKYPKYRTKKRSKKVFKPRSDKGKIYFDGSKVRIEGLPFGDKVETKWNFGFDKNTELKDSSIKYNPNGTYTLSFSVLTKKPCYEGLSDKEIDNYVYTPKYNRAIGIDLNVKNLIVTSYNNGETYKAPNVDAKLKSINKLRKQCSKDQVRYRQEIEKMEITNLSEDNLPEKSNNAKKRQLRLNKKVNKVSNIYNNHIRTVSKQVVTRHPQAIIMEDLDVYTMKSKHYISTHLGFYTPFGKIRTVFEHNCYKYGVPFYVAERDYPSSSICSNCGYHKNIYSSKYFICPNCGVRIDRDINSSFNLEHWYYQNIA